MFKLLLKKFEDEKVIKDEFKSFTQQSGLSEVDVLKRVLKKNDPNSKFLCEKRRDRYSPQMIEKKLSKLNLSLEMIQQIYNYGIVSRTSWSQMARILADENPSTEALKNWGSDPNAGSALKKMFLGLGFNISALLLNQKPKKSTGLRRRCLVETDFLTGEAVTRPPQYISARNLHQLQKQKLTHEEFRLVAVGEKTKVIDITIARCQKTGSGWKTIEYAKSTFGRYIPIRMSIDSHIEGLQRNNIIQPDVKEFYLCFWIDGSCLASLSTVLVRYRLMYTPGILMEDCESSVIDLRAVQTWITVPMHENKEAFQNILEDLLFQEMLSLELHPHLTFK